MNFKMRKEPIELLIFKSLNTRMSLSKKEKQYYLNLKKGYEGEVFFDSMTEKLECDCLIINDLQLMYHNNFFQIDTLIILPETIYLLEIKNYEGNFYYESERLYLKHRVEVTNPLIQLSRNDSLLRQLLQHLKFNIPVQAYVVFVNPEFTLYQAPLNLPFIFPTQINQFFKKLNMSTSTLNRKQKLLAEKLLLQHIDISPFNNLPTFHFDDLQKGIRCCMCGSLSTFIEGHSCVCKNCGQKELAATAILRSVKEFQLLFPDRKITTNSIHEWCKIIQTKRRIRTVLGKNYQIVGVRQWAYFE